MTTEKSDTAQGEGQGVLWSQLPEDIFKVFETRTAENCAAYLLPALTQLQHRNPLLTILDVGCGTGSMSASFANIVGPTGGYVTAVDINPFVLERGRNILTSKYGVPADKDWVSFQAGDAHKLPFKDHTFDIVHCHQVIAHNQDQPGILREMLRVTKPGGIVAAREGDLETETFWPPLPGLLKFHEELEVRIIRSRGACTSSGRQLLSWALEANGGKRDKIKTSFSAWSFTEAEDRKLWASGMISGALGNPTVRAGNIKAGITEADMDEMREAWIEWQGLDNATLSMVQGEILMTK